MAKVKIIKSFIMKKSIYIIALTLLFISCNKEKKDSKTELVVEKITQNITESEGYKLMESKCFICHFPKPDPSKRDQMIAPPMLRVQDHYKPLYPKKEDFVKAIVAWVENPTEDKVEMPGTVRKWGLMPKLGYDKKEVKLIAETIFDMDFGTSHKMHGKQGMHGNKLQLNNGKKWQLSSKAIKTTTAIITELNSFKSDKVSDYNEFGKRIFKNAKSVLLDKSISGEKLEQVQGFFHNIEENMHKMMKVTTIEEGQNQQTILKKKFSKFLNFFE